MIGTGMGEAQNVVFPMLLCPADPTAHQGVINKTNYLANWYAWGGGKGPYGPAQRFDQMTNGLSNVVLFGEGYSTCDKLPRLAFASVTISIISASPKRESRATILPTSPTITPCFRSSPLNATNCGPRPPQRHARGHGRWQRPHGLAARSATTWKTMLKPRDGTPIGSDW